MDWGILVPRGAEYAAVRRGLARRNELGNLQGNDALKVKAIAIPAGAAVKDWLETDWSAIGSVSQVLSVGLCGGVSDRLGVGAVVIYGEPKIAARLGIASVRGVTIDRVLSLAREKREWAGRADVVDMESGYIVRHCEALGVGVRVVRVVSDGVEGDLPDLSTAIDTQGNLQPWALMKAFLARPIAAVRLIRGSLMALNQLEQLVAKLDFDHLTI